MTKKTLGGFYGINFTRKSGRSLKCIILVFPVFTRVQEGSGGAALCPRFKSWWGDEKPYMAKRNLDAAHDNK
jgi:hypothetical protein